jgi:hypothetical protein
MVMPSTIFFHWTRLEVSETGLVALVRLSNGDMRKALNILQVIIFFSLKFCCCCCYCPFFFGVCVCFFFGGVGVGVGYSLVLCKCGVER